MIYCYMETPLGRLLLAGEEEGLRLIGFPEGKGHKKPDQDWRKSDTAWKQVKIQLDEYFTGERKIFDLDLAPCGTDFQMRVWDELLKIPYGETRSYGDIAMKLGNPGAARAVGAANGRNPLPIVIPCHRVIGSNGSMTGFGGGIKTKEFLLQLETDNRQTRLL